MSTFFGWPINTNIFYTTSGPANPNPADGGATQLVPLNGPGTATIGG